MTVAPGATTAGPSLSLPFGQNLPENRIRPCLPLAPRPERNDVVAWRGRLASVSALLPVIDD